MGNCNKTPRNPDRAKADTCSHSEAETQVVTPPHRNNVEEGSGRLGSLAQSRHRLAGTQIRLKRRRCAAHRLVSLSGLPDAGVVQEQRRTPGHTPASTGRRNRHIASSAPPNVVAGGREQMEAQWISPAWPGVRFRPGKG